MVLKMRSPIQGVYSPCHSINSNPDFFPEAAMLAIVVMAMEKAIVLISHINHTFMAICSQSIFASKNNIFLSMKRILSTLTSYEQIWFF